MRKLFQYILLFFVSTSLFFPIVWFWNIEFYEIFPNTIDDTNLEYVVLRNTWCDTISLDGLSLSDASWKYYYFPSDSTVVSHTNITIPRALSKIILNNTDEILYIKNWNWDILTQFMYSSSIKWSPILNINIVDSECSLDSNTWVIDSNSWSTDSQTWVEEEELTWSTDNWSWVMDNTGTIIDTVSGELITQTWGTADDSTGSIMENESHSGETIDGETISITGILFPEILPTIQSPTNALFNSWYFDCQNLDPCRINITFDPIFSSGFNARDYICEVITVTGSLLDCNPNTLYYSMSGSITFRLTSKIETNQSKSITWPIKYHEIIHDSTDNWILEDTLDTWTGIHDAIFPEIIPIFQNYTNTIFTGSNTLICNTSPCRVNMNFDNIFTGAFASKNYTCEITYQDQLYDCNPPQWYLVGSGNISIKIIEKITKQEKIVNYTYETQILGNSDNKNNKLSDWEIWDINPPIAIIEYDGKIKDYHEQIGDYEMNCYTDTCSINLTAEKSYDPEWWKINFIWYYGFNDIKTTKDPGERKYGIGDHQIWLRVIDSSWNVAQIRYYIHVLWKRIDPIVPSKTKEKIVKDKKTKNKSTSKGNPKKKKIKKIKMQFFEEPNILLQKSKFIHSDDGFICKTTSKKCSLNLKIQSPQKWIIYRWIYDDGSVIDSNNPKSKSLEIGRHSVKVIAWYNIDSPLWSKEFDIVIQKIKKPKKIKAKNKSKIDQLSWSNKEKTDIKTHQFSQNDSPKNTHEFPISVLAFFGWLVPIYWIRKYQNNIKDKNIENNRQ